MVVFLERTKTNITDNNMEKEELLKELRKIEKKEREILIAPAWKNLFSKYVGKCFKQKNSYGDGDFWFIYYKVIELNKKDLFVSGNNVSGCCICNSFEKTSYDEYKIMKKDTCFVVNLGEEISEEEFNLAYKNFKDSIEEL